MYCLSCGTPVLANSSYCNRCGTDLKVKESSIGSPSEASPESLVWALVAVTVVGLGIVIGLMAVMKQVLNFNDGLIIFFSLLTFLSFMGVDSVFIWLLMRSRMDAREPEVRSITRTEPIALPAPTPSVTEHTTHTLDHSARLRETE